MRKKIVFLEMECETWTRSHLAPLVALLATERPWQAVRKPQDGLGITPDQNNTKKSMGL